MTKKQTAELSRILDSLKRAQTYIMASRITIAHKGGPATTTLHYTRADGSTLYELNKEIGSDIAGLHDGIGRLEKFLQPEKNHVSPL